ncbi:MAG: putative rane protein [Gemmatimonadetes bacterium]|nr:putative rane protein [Gemmatimonadota bacterium]
MISRSQLAAAVVGLDALRVNPLRTVLSTLGVIIGVGALVSVLSLGDGMEHFVRSELARKTDVQTVTLSSRSGDWIDGTWTPFHDVPVFTQRDAEEMASELPMVRGMTIWLSGSARVIWPRSGKQRQVSITASTIGPTTWDRVKLAGGRFFTAGEAAHNAPVVLVSYKLADELSAGRGVEAMIGQFVRVRGVPREIVGVVAAAPGERGYSATVPFPAATSAFGADLSRDRPQVALQARTIEDMPALQRAVQDWLATRYRSWEGKVDIRVAEAQLAPVIQSIGVMKLFLGALAGISLLVGGIGIMNIMLASVTERTREIGVRKAIGARSRDIMLQFLTEAIAVSCFGSALGVALGAAIAGLTMAIIRGKTGVDSLALTLSPGTVGIAAFSAVTIGLVFGTYPARRASRLSPIDAIRHE